jgi:hypothetical protein
MTADLAPSGRQKTISLPFRLGELQLFAVKFPAWVTSAPLDPSRPQTADVPLDQLNPSIKAVLKGSDRADVPLPRVTVFKQAIRYVPAQYRRYYIDLTGTFADYQKRFSAKRRYNLAREARLLAQASGGEILWRTFRQPGEMEDFHQQACAVSKTTYQELLWEKGIPQSPAFAQHLKQSAAENRARGYILYFDNKPQAYAYCQSQGPVLQFEYTGYDPQLRRFSPGSVLLYKIIEQLFEERQFQLLDFTQGEAWYKKSFATGHVRCADVYYFRRSWFGALTVTGHVAAASLSRAASLTADKLHLKSALKRWIRQAG